MRRKSWSLAACLIGLLFTQLALAGANPLWAQYVTGAQVDHHQQLRLPG